MNTEEYWETKRRAQGLKMKKEDQYLLIIIAY